MSEIHDEYLEFSASLNVVIAPWCKKTEILDAMWHCQSEGKVASRLHFSYNNEGNDDDMWMLPYTYSNAELLVWDHPDQGLDHAMRLKLAALLFKLSAKMQVIISTHDVFLVREIHIHQKIHGLNYRYFSLMDDGDLIQGPTMDHVRLLADIDAEVEQADRYMNLEMGLTPRQPNEHDTNRTDKTGPR